ncbi:hypothetical protein N475_22230 [Pseudoalteromonas luteoviolacea DSM 6061]|uniref:DUF1566 domain-containing protein n=2 Tax=Pseudoalteromonas luteoviolacea TaxID=43657 RepID=A0A166V9R8_9GAMM|nr:DUF1566 domain-containing protein [Pseudoalteromonas luteoviolacea]KZN32402.1 hypothetical protein N475_22230 [Pseudoalteromonas luteoviolacea DSM 6061]MBE0386086.1 hypothetical protein [Pseudoalteromonas luteoviolacea DSM 6061]
MCMKHLWLPLVLALGFEVEALEVHGPKYIQPGEAVMFNVVDSEKYQQIEWQQSFFNGEIYTTGDKQQTLQLALSPTSTDSYIFIRAYGIDGWNYDIADLELEIKQNKPQPVDVSIQGPEKLSKGQSADYTLMGLPAGTRIDWVIADEFGNDRGLKVTPNGDSVTLKVNKRYSGSDALTVNAVYVQNGWQYIQTKSVTIGTAVPQPELSLEFDARYTALINGGVKATVNNLPAGAQVDYAWRVVTPPLASSITLFNEATSNVALLAQNLDVASKATLALRVEITTNEQQAVLEKEFDITINPNLAPQLSHQLVSAALWNTEKTKLTVNVSEPEQEVYDYSLDNLTPALIQVQQIAAGEYEVTASADTNDIASLKLSASDIHGNTNHQVIDINIKKLPVIAFEHASKRYTNSKVPLIANINVPASFIQNVTWRQTFGSNANLDDITTFTPSFMANGLPQEYRFELEVDLGNGVKVTNDTKVNTFPVTVLNDTGDRRLIDEADKWYGASSTTVLQGLDAQHGRDSESNLIKLGSGPDGFDFMFLDEQGQIVENFAAGAQCLKDNVSGLTWLLKSSDSYPLEQQLPLEDSLCTGSKCSVNAIIRDLNARSLCGKQDWKIPSINQTLSILSINQQNSTLAWLSNNELASVQGLLNLRTSKVNEQKNYVFLLYGEELNGTWKSVEDSAQFLLVAEQ